MVPAFSAASADSSSNSRPSPASVLVAVRVRPFSQREKERNAQLVVQMPDGRVTELRDPTGMERTRRFTFDHSYWSHDGFRVLDNGYLAKGGRYYVDQQKVFDDLGEQVLSNAWAGYNCTLFAYGQTGSGKSYSIIGFGQNRGLVPLLCHELFRRIGEAKKRNPDADFQVSISMLEIYCEKVRDLLGQMVATGGGGRGGGALRVREHPRDGFYVEGLSNWPVDSYREVEGRIMEGTRMRTIAATNMNETSSRAHTIVRLHFAQKWPHERGGEVTKRSEINLVDLAGSERQKKAMAIGGNAERQKEGIGINLSLSTLGRVIHALHEGQQMGKRGEEGNRRAATEKVHQIPYRDSVLTALLRNALGGNSKTIMIAAISPANIHYEETLSTLRFADRVKQIKTRPVVNEAKTEKLMRALREENGRLLELMHKGGLDGVASREELEALRQQLAENQREMERLERNWTEREEALKRQLSNLSASTKEDRMEERRKKVPHLWNLNEDPALTNVIVHFVDKGESTVGNGAGKAEKTPKILLKGLSIKPKHALFRNIENRKVTLIPLDDSEILVNGRRISGETELCQNDRVHFGGNHIYVFVNPHKKGATQPGDKINFEMAQKEIAHAVHLVNGSKKSKEDMILEEELINLLPYVYRANSMASELGKNVSFEIVLLPPESKGLDAEALTEVWVKVRDHQVGKDGTHLWDSSRFMSRYYGMQEMYQNYMEGGGGDLPRMVEKDPFHESATSAIPLGTATLFLQNLAYLVEMDEQVPIIDMQGVMTGQLSVSLRPCSSNSGREIVGECVERSDELIGRDLGIKVKLLSATGLPSSVGQSSCKYRFFDQGPVSTPFHAGSNPAYAHERVFLYRPITQQLVDYLTESALVIEVSAIQRSRQQSQEQLDVSPKASGNHVGKERNVATGRKDRASYSSEVVKKRTNSVINSIKGKHEEMRRATMESGSMLTGRDRSLNRKVRNGPNDVPKKSMRNSSTKPQPKNKMDEEIGGRKRSSMNTLPRRLNY